MKAGSPIITCFILRVQADQDGETTKAMVEKLNKIGKVKDKVEPWADRYLLALAGYLSG